MDCWVLQIQFLDQVLDSSMRLIQKHAPLLKRSKDEVRTCAGKICCIPNSFAVIYTNYCTYAHNFKETMYLIMPPLPFHIFFSPSLFFFSPLILVVSWALFIQTRWIIKGSYHSLSTTWLRKWWVTPVILICINSHANDDKDVCIFSTCHRGGCRLW